MFGSQNNLGKMQEKENRKKMKIKLNSTIKIKQFKNMQVSKLFYLYLIFFKVFIRQSNTTLLFIKKN